jgi:hypothetical protein
MITNLGKAFRNDAHDEVIVVTSRRRCTFVGIIHVDSLKTITILIERLTVDNYLVIYLKLKSRFKIVWENHRKVFSQLESLGK